MNYSIRTFIFFGLLASIFFYLGYLLGGRVGIAMAAVFSALTNLFLYYNSESMAVRAFGARRMNRDEYPAVFNAIEELSAAAKIPVPKIWIADVAAPNAFATGRNPQNSSVVLTTGIINLLDENELRAVIAHELSHIKNSDILVATVAAMLASAISMLAYFARNIFWFGGNRRNEKSGGVGPVVLVLLGFITPLITFLIQMAISRSREFYADESGAHLCHAPLDLASALQKIENFSKYESMEKDPVRNSFSSLFFFSPSGWFSTHPATKERVKRLMQIKF